jgi:Asp-tRNA(Asn)/Glu-tRNA(Gln) amidotransferase A subunit family amidase
VRRAFEETIAHLRTLGWDLHEAAPPPKDPSPLWTLVALCEGYAAGRALLESHAHLLEADTRHLIEQGERYTAADYLDAQYERAEYSRSWQAFFADYDALLTPTMQMTAFELGILAPTTIDGHPVDPLFDDWGAFVFPANLTGMPATTVPCGYDDRGLPVGLQVMAPRGADSLTIAVAAAWEQEFGDLRRWPQVPAG